MIAWDINDMNQWVQDFQLFSLMSFLDRRSVFGEKGGVTVKGAEHSIGELGYDPGNTPGLSAAIYNRQQRTLAFVVGEGPRGRSCLPKPLDRKDSELL